jgi:tRNA(Ile)-lysidine synthase
MPNPKNGGQCPPYGLEDKLAAAWPPAEWADVTVLLAVSGGCDSVALLRAMTAIRMDRGGRLCVAHVNHQLRSDADRDAAFVADLCRQLEIPCEIGRVVIDGPTGIEAAARAARYRFLEDAAGRLGARYVVTAHTADDQVETILHRVFRGTGIGGLAGISRVRRLGHATLIRPLLEVRHAELAEYLAAISQSFCEDSTNTDVRFTRNRIRHELVPWLEGHVHPSVGEGVLRLGRLAGEAQAVIDSLVASWFDRCVAVESGNGVCVDLTRFVATSSVADAEHGGAALRLAHPTCLPQPYLIRELLMAVWRRQKWPMQAMGLSQWDQLAAMAIAAASDSGSPPESGQRQIFPGAIAAEAVAGRLRLARLE